MMRNFLLFTLVAAYLAACSGNQPGNEIPVSAEPSPMEEPGEQPPTGPINTSHLPQSEDSNFSRGEVFIDSTELQIMESFPVQVALVLKGNLPTPCHQLRVVANPPDEQNRIQVEAYSVADPEEMCIQILEPFEENISLGSFPSGHYSVWVNGEMVGEFDS